MTELYKSIITSLLSIVGGILISKGIFSAADWSTLSQLLVAGAGAAIGAGTLIYKAWKNSQAQLAVSASKVPGVTVSADKNTASPTVVQAALDPTNAVKLGGA